MSIFTLALIKTTKQKANFLLVLLFPIPLLLIPENGNGFNTGLGTYGLLNMFTAFLLCRPLVEDRMRGVLLRIAAAPIHYLKYAAGHLSAYLLVLCIQIALFMAGTILIRDYQPVQYFQLSILYLAFSFMSTAFAVAWNSLFTSYSLSFALFSGFGSLLALISGVSIPLMFIPEGLQLYTRFLPPYWLPYGIDAIYRHNLSGLVLSVMILCGYAAVMLLAGTKRRL
jgi:ABC-2 type transport system permease protein